MTNVELKILRSLSDKKERMAQGRFLAEGEKLVGELLESNLRVERVYVVGEQVAVDRAAECGSVAVPLEQITAKEMERISALKTPTSVLALVEIPRWEIDLSRLGEQLTLVLDDVQDPGNLGTIIRVADWFGVQDVVCSPASADCFNPKVVQATMGAIARVRVHYLDLSALLSWTAAQGVPCYGTFLDGERLHEASLTSGGLLVMGNEGRGISSTVSGYINRRLFIPPYPQGAISSESLNVSVATAIVCAEFRRR